MERRLFIKSAFASRSETEQLLDTVLALPETDRVEFAEALIASLRPKNRPQFDESWRPVIERRTAELRSGSLKAGPWHAMGSG
jgi:putative addiction module component (TIGR02574 family)